MAGGAAARAWHRVPAGVSALERAAARAAFDDQRRRARACGGRAQRAARAIHQAWTAAEGRDGAAHRAVPWRLVVSMKLSVIRKDASFALGLLRRRPFQVLVQVTNRCNMKCSFCDFWPNVAPK